MSEPKIIPTKQAERLKRAVAEISEVTGLDPDRIMRAIGMEFFGISTDSDRETK